MIEIRVFTSFDLEVESLWRSFEAEAEFYPFQTYDWLSCWHRTLGAPLHGITLCIIVILQGKSIHGVLPFGIRTTNGLHFLEWLGGIQGDYSVKTLSLNDQRGYAIAEKIL